MNRSVYREQDFAFGQIMLTLRTAIGITQGELATILGVSRQSVSDWEAGRKYPKSDHLKTFITLAFQHHAFAAGQEAEDIRALWKAARQKVLLDEAWLSALVGKIPNVPIKPVTRSLPAQRQRMDWDDAVSIPTFFGRESELNLLMTWVVEENCRVINVLGMGGIGKSTVTVRLMHQAAEHYEVVIWRSLRDLPNCDVLLDSLLQVAAPHMLTEIHTSLERRQAIVLDYMRNNRVLLVLDNLETVLEEGADAGRLRPEYDGLGRFLRLCAETRHQSCVLLTSREKPQDLMRFEGSNAPVRTLRLTRLDTKACEQLLAEREVVGSQSEQSRLIDAYAGNPLALKIVSQTILDLFGGEIAPFLEQGEVIFGGIRELLATQFNRLSTVEQNVMLWLAIMREHSNLDELAAVMTVPIARGRLLEAVDALHRRSLVERGHRQGSFTLQSVVLEYATAQLIAEASAEILSGSLSRLTTHGIELAHSREYVRQTQERLLALPILAHLQSEFPQTISVDDKLLALLDQLRLLPLAEQGYASANLVTLLRLHRTHLRGVDMSRLLLRELSFQGVAMQDASLANALIVGGVFTEAFDAMVSVAISRNGAYWAASSRRGEVRIWSDQGQTLYRAWRAHMDMIMALAFSSDGQLVATGSWDKLVKVWDVATGDLLWSALHTGEVVRVAFSPDDRILASNGGTETILWDVQTGNRLDHLPQEVTPTGIAWSRTGHLLTTSNINGDIRVWSPQAAGATVGLRTIAGGPLPITGLAFSLDDSVLVSAGTDGTVKLWDVESGGLLHSLEGHTDRVRRVVWSPDGRTIASAGRDQTIWLWDYETKTCRTILYGHTAEVWSLAFSADSQTLFSASVDGTLRVWDAVSGRCIRIVQSYATTIFDVSWSPDSTRLVSGGTNAQVTIWDTVGSTPPQVLSDYSTIVCSLGWSADGRYVATSEWDHAIRLWDAHTRSQVEMLQPPDENGNMFYNLAWKPDGLQLAWGTYNDALLVYDIANQTTYATGTNFPTRMRYVEWSPNGRYVAGCGYNSVIYIWDSVDFRLVKQIVEHQGMIMSMAWNGDGKRLAAGGMSSSGGELIIWNIDTGDPGYSLIGLEHAVSAMVWDTDEETLIIGSSDGKLRWLDLWGGTVLDERDAHEGTVQTLRRSPDRARLASGGNDGAIMLWDMGSRQHLQTLRRDRPYERLKISGIRGINDTQKTILRSLGAIEAE